MDPHRDEFEAGTRPPFTDAEVKARLATAATPAESVEAFRDLLCPELFDVLAVAISAQKLGQTETWPFPICFNIYDARWLRHNHGKLSWVRHEQNMHERWVGELFCAEHTTLELGPGIIAWPG